MLEKVNELFIDFYKRKNKEKLVNIKTSEDGILLGSVIGFLPAFFICLNIMIFFNSSLLYFLSSMATTFILGFIINKIIFIPYFKKKNKELLKKIDDTRTNKIKILENFHEKVLSDDVILCIYSKKIGIYNLHKLKNTLMTKEEIENASKIIISEVGESVFKKEMESDKILNLIRKNGGITYHCMMKVASKINQSEISADQEQNIKKMINDLVVKTRESTK